MPHSTSLRGEDDLGLCCTPITPHRSVIRPQDSNHNPSHTAAVVPRPRKAPVCWIDRPPRQERPATRCAGRDAGSDPHETFGFAAQWVFLRHTHRAGRSRLDSSSWKGESPPSAASCRDPPLRQHGPRSRRANPRRGDHPRHRRPAHPPRVLTGVKAASLPLRPPLRGAGGLDAGSAHAPQRATVRRCQTASLPHNDRAGSVSGAPRQRSGAARSCREGGSAFRLARKSEPARSGAAVTLKGPQRSGGPAELAEQVDGRGRPCAPGRRGRPALILLPSERPRRRPHRRRGRTGATRRKAVRGRGAEPPPAPMSDIGYAGS